MVTLNPQLEKRQLMNAHYCSASHLYSHGPGSQQGVVPFMVGSLPTSTKAIKMIPTGISRGSVKLTALTIRPLTQECQQLLLLPKTL